MSYLGWISAALVILVCGFIMLYATYTYFGLFPPGDCVKLMGVRYCTLP